MIKKVNWLCMFFYMIPNPPMYVFQTRHEHFGFFRSLMFCLKFTRELLATFFIFTGSCCYNCGTLYAIISRPQYTVFGNWVSKSLGFLMVYGIFLNLYISFIIGGDIPFRHLKISIISCWKFLIWMFIESCSLKSLS